MNIKKEDILDRQVDITTVYKYFFVVAFSIYLLFPMVNFFRRINGGNVFFPLWRDYIFIVAIIFALIHIFLYPQIWDNLKRADLKNSVLSNPTLIFLALLTIWMVISGFVTGLDYETVIGSEKSHTGLICSLVYNVIFVMALCTNLKKNICFWIGLLLAVGSVVSGLIIFDYFACGSAREYTTDNMFFYNENHLSYYLLIVTVCAYNVFLLAEKNYIRITSILAFSVGTASILLADTLGCYVALAMSFVFSIVVFLLTGKFKWKRFLAVILVTCLVFLVLIFVPNVDHETAKKLLFNNFTDLNDCMDAVRNLKDAADSSGSGRMVLWKKAVQATFEKPIFGNGLSRMRNILYTASDGVNDTVHNEFLEYSSNQGIPALIFYVAFVLSVFIRGAKNRKSLTNINIVSLCVAFSYLVSSFFGVTMFYTAPYLFIFLAFGYYKTSDLAPVL